MGDRGVGMESVVLLFLNQLYFVSIYLEEGTQSNLLMFFLQHFPGMVEQIKGENDQNISWHPRQREESKSHTSNDQMNNDKM